MGIFDFVTELVGSNEKKIEFYARKVRHKDTPVEQREAAAVWLAEEGSHDAIVGMLGRFEMTYEHQMKDQVEKDRVERILLSLGSDAIEPVADFMRRSRSFARAMKVYRELAGVEAAKALNLELLDVEFAKSGLKPKKKHDLLVMLANFRGADVTESAMRFLDDFNEGCRYACVEVLIVQDETPAIRDALLARLSPEEESGRVKHRIADVASQRRWKVGDVEVPENFKLKGGHLIAG